MKHVFLIFWCLYFSLVAYGTDTAFNSNIQQIIQKYGINKDQLGIEISLGSKKIFSVNSDKKFIPASVTKILTSYVVLKNLPLNYKFKTELFFDGTDLYIKGSGDPSFVSENMWFLVNEFVRKNTKSIHE